MITPSFSLTATERVLPKLALDFTTASLDSRVTFTRAGATATRVNASGYIETMAANAPRFDFNPSTLVCKGLLIEESRINLKTYSQDLSNASAWATTYSTTLTSGFVSPDNTTNGVKALNTAGAVSLVEAAITVAASATNLYYPTLFVKKGNTSTVTLNVYYSLGTEHTVNFNLDTLAVTGAPVANAYIFENYGNGWYRIGYQMPVDATGLLTQISYRVWESARGTGVAGNFQYYFGAQLEAGAFATSYIPTTTLAVTRNADVAVMTGTNFSSWFNQTAGAFVVQAIVPQLGQAGRLVEIDAGTTANMTYVAVGATNQCLIEGNVGGGYSGGTYTANTIAANTSFKVCASYSTTAAEPISLNAGTVASSNFSVATTMTQMNLGSQVGPSTFLNGCLSKISYWKQSLTNNEIQAFSK